MIVKNNFKNIEIVPKVNKVTREMSESSLIGIVLKDFLSLDFRSKFLLMFNNIKNLLDLARMDYASGVVLLSELSFLKLKHKKKYLLLHNQMVDMALALKNKKVLSKFFFMCQTYKCLPALKTYNLEFLIKSLSTMVKIPKDLLIYSPTPNNKGVLDFIEKSAIKFVVIDDQKN